MSYFLKNPITEDELIKWSKNKFINPRTNRKIKKTGSIYKYLNKKFNYFTNNVNTSKKNFNYFNYTLLDVSTNEEPITLKTFYDQHKNITVNEKKYIIYKETETNRIQAFHYKSILGLRNNKIIKHPITQNKIPSYVFDLALQKSKKFNYVENNNISLEQLALKAFQYFNSLSIFINHQDFIKLNDNIITKLTFELQSFFSANLNQQQKLQFNKITFFNDSTKENILNEIIFIMETVSDNDKIFISYLILGALSLFIPSIKSDYPFLEFEF